MASTRSRTIRGALGGFTDSEESGCCDVVVVVADAMMVIMMLLCHGRWL